MTKTFSNLYIRRNANRIKSLMQRKVLPERREEMAKKIVHSTRPLCLGNSINAPHLKVGKNEVEESALNGWYIQELVKAGDIRIEEPPALPMFEPEGLVTVSITPEKVDVEERKELPEAKVEKYNPEFLHALKQPLVLSDLKDQDAEILELLPKKEDLKKPAEKTPVKETPYKQTPQEQKANSGENSTEKPVAEAIAKPVKKPSRAIRIPR